MDCKNFTLKQGDSTPVYSAFSVIDGGGFVPIRFGEVYAIVADPLNVSSVESVRKYKGRPENQPFAVLLDMETFSTLIDWKSLSQNGNEEALLKLLKDPADLNTVFGNKAFIRATIDRDPGVPDCVLGSDETLQAFTFYGNAAAFDFEKTLRDELKKRHSGLGLILITSYNKHGSDSIRSFDEAEKETQANGFPMLIHADVGGEGQGSYAIFEVGIKGIRRVRNGTGQDEVEKLLEERGIKLYKYEDLF